jgi:hypothetical protein
VILKLFLSDGMPVLEALLKSRCEDVTSMLKILQVTTRYLHALCISTKVTTGMVMYMTYIWYEGHRKCFKSGVEGMNIRKEEEVKIQFLYV